jgi:hypothetical protein
MKTNKKGFKRLFFTKGACSHTLFYILNREFGHLKENEECASDPFAGGIVQTGHQCGMLWGAALGVGAESFRRHDNRNHAIGVAIAATQYIMESFTKRAKSVNCREITGCDFTSKYGLVKYFLLGKPIFCVNLAGKWAPEAIRSAHEGLSHEQPDMPQTPISCASEVAGKMGACDEEMVMVAGFAGGMGLSGNGCGALAAAVWMTILGLVRKKNWKYSLSDPVTGNILRKFKEATNGEMACHKICGRYFKSIDEHTEFIKNGGCENLMNVLARS